MRPIPLPPMDNGPLPEGCAHILVILSVLFAILFFGMLAG
jgi:hypothetical protein